MKRSVNYSSCGKPTDNKLLGWFLSLFYHTHTIKKNMKGSTYIVEYTRAQFSPCEMPSLRLFFEEKFNMWNGQVWMVYPSGGMCGYGTTYVRKIFPRRKMKEFLVNEINRQIQKRAIFYQRNVDFIGGDSVDNE